MYLFEGKVSKDQKIFVDSACPIEDIYEKAIRRIHIRIDITVKKAKNLGNIISLLKENAGTRDIILHIKSPAKEIRVLSREFRVLPSESLIKQLRKEFGKDNIWLEYVKKIF